ncbi:MAG: CHAT domain-containing protein [Cyanobacteria bacterium P01_F01_bin.150]
MTPLKKFLFILCASTLMVLCGYQITLSLDAPNADALTMQGHMALQQKDYQQAIALFQQAEALYQEEGNDEGVIGTQVNQAIALDQAGHKRRACKQLSQTLHITGVCDAYGLEDVKVEHSINNGPGIIGLQALSNLLIDIGHLEEANTVIEQLIILAPNDPITLLAQLTLKNAEIEIILDRQKLSTKEITPALLTQIQQKVSEGDRLLPQLLDAPKPILLPAIIHALKTEALIDKTGITIEQTDKADLYHSFLSVEHFQSLGDTRFNALASTIDSLIQLDGNQQHIAALLESTDHAVATQKEQAKLAFLQGQFLDSQTTNKQLIESFYQRAAELATLSHHPILAYSSYHQLALLNSDSSDRETLFFQQAIAQLEQAKSTLAITPRLLPKLEYDIQSIFHDYMAVLIQQGQPIGLIHSTMKQWRIDTYLRCSNYIVSDTPNPSDDDSIIHITLLDDVIVTSVQKDDMEQQYFADKEPALNAIHRLLHELEPSNATNDLSALKTASQQTYEWLLKTAIEDNFTLGDTLQFNVDPALETLPIAALFNGEREKFLIEEFSITYNTNVNQHQHHSNAHVALIGSMSIQNPNHAFSLQFPPLPEVELEASTIEAILKRSYRLNNERFTLDNLKDVLEEQQPSIIHIATHGIFSADPRKTALVAWDRSIHPQTLGQLLSQNPLQLLVLSSCETAQGGRLGIAGLALQSGAQDTIASLAGVDSRATYVLMSEFYRFLEEGQSVEQSLQTAQQTLLNSTLFNHPAYWSPFILISS